MSPSASPRLHDEQESEPAAESLLGRVLGERYELEAVLGRGSMGTVYRARHRRLDRMMAVKVLRPALVRDDEAVERFHREAAAVSKLDHENCVQVIDFGCEDALHYLVMQLLEGPSLREMMGGPMPVGRAVDLASQILDGLEHAHRRGLVHRDLKPENVIVVRGQGGRDVAKLVDFGLAKLVQPPASERRLTQAGIVFGTPLYMSPEQATGGQADPRTDVYAAGVILFEMLAGEAPFFDPDPATLAAMHVTREPPALPLGVPLALSPVLRRMLAKRSEDRYRTAHAAASALRRALSPGHGNAAGPRTTAPYSDPAAAVVRAALQVELGESGPPELPRRPTARPFRVDPPPKKPARARASTSLDPTLPPVAPPPTASPTSLAPKHRRGLWIAPVPAPELERHAALARLEVDHALVEREATPKAPAHKKGRAIAVAITLAVLAVIATAVLAT